MLKIIAAIGISAAIAFAPLAALPRPTDGSGRLARLPLHRRHACQEADEETSSTWARRRRSRRGHRAGRSGRNPQ